MAEALDEALLVLVILIAITSLVGNSLVCHIIVRTKSMKTSMNYLLLNLAIVDALTGILAIFNVVINDRAEVFGMSRVLERVYNTSTTAAKAMCKVEASFWTGSTVTPVMLVVIAYERYMAVVHPLTRRSGQDGVARSRLKLILPVCWLWALSFLTADMISTTYVDGVCELASVVWFNMPIYASLSMTLNFLIPSVVLFVLYFRVIKTLRSADNLGIQAAARRARNKAKKKVVFVVITVTLIFYICSGIPYILFFLFEMFYLSFGMSSGGFSMLLTTLNSASNPFIYFTFITAYRDALKVICRRPATPQRNVIPISHPSLTEQPANNNSSGCDDNSHDNQPKLKRIIRDTNL